MGATTEPTTRCRKIPGGRPQFTVLGTLAVRTGDELVSPGGPKQSSQDDPGVPGHVEAGDMFGAAVASKYIGVPGEDLGSIADAGAVVVDWSIWGGG